MINFLNDNKKIVGLSTSCATLFFATPVFASEGSAIVSNAIKTAVSNVTSEASNVIAAAVGLGALFWGAQVLWTKFKSMAK